MGNTKKLTGLLWFNIVLFGFMGQIAWAVENVYFNTFLFNYIGGTTDDISKMVAASAATACITTIIMGALSDRLNRRKIFLSGGYIIWGLSVCVFAFISRDRVAGLFGINDTASIIAATVSIVIIMDCVMTFFGSTSNDAAFNAWITDITSVENRGTVEAILAMTPIFATVIVTVVFGALVSGVGYGACFIGLGAIVTLCGIVGIFTVKDSLNGEKRNEKYLSELAYGFKPKVIKQNKQLYIILVATAIFNTAVQCFLPYIFIYLQHFLGFSFDNLVITPKIIVVGVLAVAAVVGVLIGFGKMIDRLGKTRFVLISAAVFVVGLVCAFFAKSLGIFGICALPVLAGYGLLMIILNASVRDFTPEGMAGRFQGIRMIFMVLLPMVIGPAVGSAVIKSFNTGLNYSNDYGELVAVPVPQMFLAAAAISVLIFIPLIAVRKDLKNVNI